MVVSRLSTTVVSAASTQSPSTGVVPDRRATTAAHAAKNPIRSSSAASGTPASRNASAGHNESQVVSMCPTVMLYHCSSPNIPAGRPPATADLPLAS